MQVRIIFFTDMATSFNRVVLPAFGGDTIIPLCPLPMGLNKSMTRIATGQPKRSISVCCSERSASYLQVASSGCFLCGITIDRLDIKQGGEFFILCPHSGISL